MNRLKLVLLSVVLFSAFAFGVRAQSTNTNLVVITIVGMPPAEVVRLMTPLVVETGVQLAWAGVGTNATVTFKAATVRTFTIERDYSSAKPEWRQWYSDNSAGQVRNAAIAFLAEPGIVINTLQFLDCLPQAYSIGPNTNGVVVERLTVQPTALPP